MLRDYFTNAYTPQNLIVSAVGNLEHARVRDLVEEKFGVARFRSASPSTEEAPTRRAEDRSFATRSSSRATSASASSSYPQNHDDRYSSYVLNTLLGGSMSSRLFQNVREKRGLAYAVFSGLSAYRDAGSFTIYAGCANEAVGEVIDLVVEELRGDQADAGARRRAAARQGSSQGQPDAEPREHRRAACRIWRGRRSTSTGSSASTRRCRASSG